ncbi:MAG: T9SS type A sorting domain-containing protein [Flavobacteriaceae bacterium]
MIKKLFLVALLVISQTKSLALTEEFALVSNNIPIFSNFKVESSEPYKIYFDSNIEIQGNSVAGFLLNDNTITGIHINSGQITNHYFTVLKPFKWYNYNSIKYVGGSDIKGINLISLPAFDLQYIVNHIKPSEGTSKIYYVNANVSSSGNGSSESSAFKTIQEAVNVVRAGDKVWIKAGNYGREIINFKRGGTSDKPITFEGYKNSPGDITDMYYNFGDGNLKSSEMPLLDGKDRSSGRAISLYNSSYVIMRNLQITNYTDGIISQSLKAVVLENILLKDMGSTSSNVGRGIVFNSSTDKANNNLFKNCTVINSTMWAFMFAGSNNLIENCKAYTDEANNYNDINATTDYYFIYRGNNNIVRNSYAEKATKNGWGHFGHGFSIKVRGENNLTEHCTGVNIYDVFVVRHRDVKYNVFRNCESHAKTPNRRSGESTGGIALFAGGNSNIFESIYVHDVSNGIIFIDNSEDGGATSSGIKNVIRNCIFENVEVAVRANNTNSSPSVAQGNLIQNNTFHKVDYLFRIYNTQGATYFSNNYFTNNIFSEVKKLYDTKYAAPSGWNYEYNDFYRGITPLGNNSFNVDPKFLNSLASDYRLSADSQLIDVGKTISTISQDYDYNGITRPQGDGFEIGAFEFEDTSVGTTSGKVNAGEDQGICLGEKATLSAEGEGTFLWSTGETTQSIEVEPTETTTYTVTMTDGSGTESSDDVVVSVADAPTVNLGEDLTICEGETITLTAEGSGDFLWSTGETTSSIEVTPTESTTYSVEASNSCGAVVTDEINITVNPGITLEISQDTIICSGDSLIINATSNGELLWSTGETTSDITVSPTETTTYTVTATSATCSVTKEVTISVDQAPSVTLGEDLTICEGETVTIVAEGTGSFLWSTGDTTQSIDVSPTATMVYTVEVSSTCGTTVSDEIVINVTSGINLNAGADVTICNGESITLTASGNGEFLWDNGETTASITVNPTQTTTYTVTASNGNCAETDEVTVIVGQAPIADLGEDQTICYGETVILTVSGNAGFKWSTGETSNSIAVSPTVTTSYTVEVMSTCGTVATDEITIYVNENIDLNAGEDVSICPGEQVILTATGNGDFLWSTGEITQSITVSPDQSTLYTVTSSLGSCTMEDEILVNVEISPSVSLDEDFSICMGEKVTLNAIGYGNFIWSTGETTSSIVVSPTESTLYTVRAVSSNCDEMEVYDEIFVTVNSPITASAGENITIQEGEKALLTATGGDEYLWNTGETTQSIIVQPFETTIYNVEVGNGTCSELAEVEVTVIEKTLLINDGLDITICRGEEVTLTASGGTAYLWDTGDMQPSITVKPYENRVYSVSSLRNNEVYTADIKIVVEDCAIGKEKEINIYPNPTSDVVNIHLPGLKTKVKVIVYALNGSLVYNKEIKADNNGVFTQIDMSSVAKGIYLIRIFNNEYNETKKILVV